MAMKNGLKKIKNNTNSIVVAMYLSLLFAFLINEFNILFFKH